jgi:molybdenum cofactor cytidylyltransferase
MDANAPATEAPWPFCVIPAAGRSSRMEGCASGGFKPLLPWKGSRLIDAVISSCIRGGARPLVVSGYRSQELEAALSGYESLAIVRNDAWEAGMLGSIRLGAEEARRLDPRGLGFFVAPADMPLLPPRAFGALLHEAVRRSGAGMDSAALFPSVEGELGHPVWIPFAFLPAMAALKPDGRLRAYLMARSWASLEQADRGVILDLDTPEAYAKACPPH